MSVCVAKDTIIIIERSEFDDEIKLINAVNAGFTESEVEILTEEEYQVRKANEPVPPKEPTELELLKQKLYDAEQVAADTSQSQQELIELLLEMGVL